MIKYLLWDIDNTLLDFKQAEIEAMTNGFKKYMISIEDPDAISRYNAINNSYWKRLELGEIDRDEVLLGRFREFFDLYEVPWDEDLVTDFNLHYQTELGNHIFFNPGAEETLRSLGKDYKQYAVTNGSKIAQVSKLKNSGLDEVFDGVYISEDLGVDKPYKEFFDKVFTDIGSTDTNEYIIIGDSLTSDIKGGKNAGIKTIWYNPEGKINDTEIHPDFEIGHLSEVIEIIDELNND